MSSLIDKKKTGLVFNVQKYSLHDGPGIRTVVFLKGCPLKCKWCSNPESQSFKQELAFNANKCLTVSKCTRCLDICSFGAISRADDDKIQVDRELCTNCMSCVDACPAGALVPFGDVKSVDEVLKSVEEDSLFYARSEGGMTLSGGEPLAQAEFAIALLREARVRRIHTAIETCGHVPYEVMEEACGHLNYLLMDIKTMDSEKHKEVTGVPNELILSNFEKIAKRYPDLKILARTPVIPGVNDTEQDIQAILDFIKPFPNVEYEILPYHRLGTQKYEQVGMENLMGDVTLSDEVFLRLQKLVEDRNVA